MPTPRLRLGQLLVDARLISAASLEEVLDAQRADGRRLGALLVERGLVNETQLTQILSHQLSIPWVSLLHIEFSQKLLKLVPGEIADRFCLVPIYVRHVRTQGETLYVAMEDPTNDEALRVCHEHAKLPVRAMIAPPSDIRGAIRAYYGLGSAQITSPPQPPSPLRGEGGAGAGQASASPSADAKPQPPPEPEPAPAPSLSAEPEPAPAPSLSAQPEPAPAPSLSAQPEPAPAPSLSAQPEPAPAPSLSAQPEPAPSPSPEPPALSPNPDSPEIEAVEIPLPERRSRGPRMIALTFLDGTTIPVPARKKARRVDTVARPRRSTPPPPPDAGPPAAPAAPASTDDPVARLSTRELVRALRLLANGADAREVLGETVRWEALFSALLSVLLKKQVITDEEFAEELKRQL